jgi:two-component system sensor histidine kinase DegS
MTKRDAPPALPLREAIAAEAATLERELAEIDMLIAQARHEAERHEQRRSQTAEKVTAAAGVPKEAADLSAQLVTLTKRAAMMEAQVDVLEGKRKALARFRDALVRFVELPDADATIGAGNGAPGDTDFDSDVGGLPKRSSRAVMGAQEDLRREIARAMHDGPAQSLTNIVLQAQIVERLVEKDPALAKGEVRLLTSMVQQTLDATKSFIFDVRPMVLDDLGLVPTLRRAARERGRRAGLTIEFDSAGADRRLSVDLESGLFRILDEAMAGYLSTGPDSLSLRLDWNEQLEAIVAARRAGAELAGVTAEPDLPDGKDLPPALAAMVEERRDERKVKAEKAREAAIAALPKTTWREVQQRAATIGATVELLDGGGTLRVTAPLSSADGEGETAAEPVED